MEDFAAILTAWARTRPDIEGLVLIGSRQRGAQDSLRRADPHSDWDFHVIARDPEVFANRAWMAALPGVAVRTYSARRAAIGGVPRVTALTAGSEIDLVIIPARALRLLTWVVRLGLHRRSPKLRRQCQDLAVVIRPGWTFLKSNPRWERWYARVVDLVPDPRIGDEEALMLAETFVCHWVWTRRKIDRGEFRAAQRMMLRELAETNYRLLHEVKLRAGEPSFPEARRIERVATAAQLEWVTVGGGCTPAELEADHAQCRVGLEALMKALVGPRWAWPS